MPATLGRFIWRTLGWLPPCVAVWYLTGPLFVWPGALLSRVVARGGFGRLFAAVERDGTALGFVTTVSPATGTAAGGAGMPATAAGARLAFEVDALIYTAGVPLLAALTLAAGRAGLGRRLGLGLLMLVPFQAWGMVADALQTVSGGLGPAAAARAGFSPLEREVIAFAYQLGHLMLPVVAPVAVWVAMHQPLLRQLAPRLTDRRRRTPPESRG